MSSAIHVRLSIGSLRLTNRRVYGHRPMLEQHLHCACTVHFPGDSQGTSSAKRSLDSSTQYIGLDRPRGPKISKDQSSRPTHVSAPEQLISAVGCLCAIRALGRRLFLLEPVLRSRMHLSFPKIHTNTTQASSF